MIFAAFTQFIFHLAEERRNIRVLARDLCVRVLLVPFNHYISINMLQKAGKDVTHVPLSILLLPLSKAVLEAYSYPPLPADAGGFMETAIKLCRIPRYHVWVLFLLI